jgi:hypothetical protein
VCDGLISAALEVPLPPAAPATTDSIADILQLLAQSDSVEFKLTVPDTDQRSALEALGVDPLEAEFRQAVFFDTPDLALDKAGVVVRARRVRGAGDVVVKLRPVVPSDLSKKVRNWPGFGVEVDAMPGKLVCSGTLKSAADNESIKRVVAGTRPLRKLLTPAQKELFAAQAPAGIDLDSLIPLGPVNLAKVKFSPPGFQRRMVAEVWFFPNGSRILELSTKCLPAEAGTVLMATKALLADHGVVLSGAQETKTRAALQFFSKLYATRAAKAAEEASAEPVAAPAEAEPAAAAAPSKKKAAARTPSAKKAGR